MAAQLDYNFLDLVERDLVLGAVVELCGAWIGMAGDFRGVYRIEKPAHILSIENGRFSFGRGVARPANGMSGIERNDLPNDQVIEEYPQTSQVKIFARFREVELFEIGRDMDGFNSREGETAVFTPGEEAVGRTEIRLACVVVFNRGGEKLDESLLGVFAERADRGREEALTGYGVIFGVIVTLRPPSTVFRKYSRGALCSGSFWPFSKQEPQERKGCDACGRRHEGVMDEPGKRPKSLP